MDFDPNQIPVEYGVKNGNIETRMVLQSEYAKLEAAYWQLHYTLKLIKEAIAGDS